MSVPCENIMSVFADAGLLAGTLAFEARRFSTGLCRMCLDHDMILRGLPGWRGGIKRYRFILRSTHNTNALVPLLSTHHIPTNTMRSSFVALAFAIFGTAVRGSPVAPDLATIAASFPVVPLGDTVGTHSNTTLPLGGVHADTTQATFPADFLFCSDFACGTSCEAFDLSTLPEDVCFNGPFGAIGSVAVVQPSNAGLPFAVVVGPPNCVGTLLLVPTVNTCFVVNSAANVIGAFEILP
ncbi:hypothetical protein BC628DRAFT_527041 [Trametes gibbosa]|nr:hypothetical protein BC628DRAFT_527041 [Trametes gibbosa]